MDPRIQRNTATSGTLVLRENPDADVPGCNADDEGENDRGLTATDTKTRSLKPGTACQIEFRLIHMTRPRWRSVPHGDDVVFSTDATGRPAIATGPSE